MMKDAEEQDGEPFNLHDIPTTPPTTVTSTMSPSLVPPLQLPQSTQTSKSTPKLLLMNEAIVSPPKPLQKKTKMTKCMTCDPCDKIIMSDDSGHFRKNPKLHGLHCVTCSVIWTTEHIRKEHLSFHHCNRIGTEGHECQNVECSTCQCNEETNGT